MKTFTPIQILFAIILVLVLLVPFINFKSFYVDSGKKCLDSKFEFYKKDKSIPELKAKTLSEDICKKFQKDSSLFYKAPTFNNFTYYSWLVLGVVGTGAYFYPRKKS